VGVVIALVVIAIIAILIALMVPDVKHEATQEVDQPYSQPPAEVVFDNLLPPCPVDQSLTMGVGLQAGYNFRTRKQGASPDFYLSEAAGDLLFMADQPGQGGLLDLGDLGETSLSGVILPAGSPDYAHNGVPAEAAHTYAALATDGQSVIVFTVADVTTEDQVELSYIVWGPDEAINECITQVKTPLCGDGARDLPVEQCDSPDLTGCQLGQLCGAQCQCVWIGTPGGNPTQTCAEQWYCSEDPNQKGTMVHVRTDCSVELLPGNPACMPSTSGGSTGGGGSVCGNGIIEPGEVCDPPQAVCGGCLPTCDGYITLC
jgi:hypothetical protein